MLKNRNENNMAILRKQKTSNFTTVNNYFINDPNLKADGKVFLLFMLSKFDDWKFNFADYARIYIGGGNRDRTKRPIMDNIASELSDYVIFINDNPRNEDSKEIMNDIIEGVTKENFEVILDRKLAIKKENVL